MSRPFRVKVNCWSARSKRPVSRWFVVMAEKTDEAMEMARAFAEATAAFGPKWIGFKSMECYSTGFPLEINP